MKKASFVASFLVLSLAILDVACSSSGGGTGNSSGGTPAATGGNAGAEKGGSGGAGGNATGGQSGTGPSYGWVVRDPGSGYTVMSMWGDTPGSMWAVDEGGRLLLFDGSAWQFAFGGALPGFNAITGLPGKNTLFIVGDSGQYYQVRGADVYDLSQGDGVNNLAVWAAGTDLVWLGANSVGRPLAGYRDKNWTSYGPDDLGAVQGIWGAAANDVWAVDNAGMILHWNGTSWSKASVSPTSPLFGIHGSGPSDVWTVGPRSMFHWDGTRWSEISDGRGAGMIAVWVAAPNDVWTVGGDGRIMHGGTSGFKAVPSGTSLYLYTIWGTSPTDIWSGGENGVLLHYENTNGATPPDAGPACKQQGEACGIGDCCYPYRCTRLAANIAACA